MKKYFDTQLEFQKLLYKKDLSSMSHEEKVKLSMNMILAAHKELSEILDCFEWKSHRKEDKLFTRSNIGEEIIDVFKYVINLCILWDISPKDFDKLFDDKTKVVLQRYRQEMLKQIKSEKVCAIDLDDVLCKWEEFFVKTFNEKNKTSYKSDGEIRININTLKYREFKHWFRDSGIKRNIPVMEDAQSLTYYLKKKGYRIVIISSRPYKDYSRLFPDTLNWLERNKIKYDDLYFEENKHLKILKTFPKLSFMIEDNEKYAQQVAKEGYKVFLFRRLNSEIVEPKNKNIVVIHKLKDMKEYI